ncbi:hypothetical protein NX059_000603 [Plenodomus lindquistii]|nr:hypothetical protein NX059_000603 [Plenodomus lindquistii]
MSAPRNFSDARLRKLGFSAAVLSLIVEYNGYLIYKGTHPYWPTSKSDVKETPVKDAPQPTSPYAIQFTTAYGIPMPHFAGSKKD